ncbi:protein kinase [Xenophilus sp.]|uniref:protein kinase domain-containing protein n=1 Tax=Xenophilus sp. TaxID=1873499 RepID=UPI0037DDD258
MPPHALPRVSVGQHSAAGRNGPNQDFHGAMLPAGHLLAAKGIALALVDGIGSSRVSQVASAAAVRGFLDDYYATSEAWSTRRSAERVLGALNAWLHAQNQRGDARFDKDRGYVCTFSALILKGRRLHLLHVGDARIYRVHAQALEQLTQDHRVRVSDEEAYLGRALGIGAHVEIDHHDWEAEPGELYLLATDGAYTHLDAATVHETVAGCGGDLDAAARMLVAQAHDRGSEDDATVQLLRVDALPEPGADALHRQRETLALPPPLAAGMRFEGFTVLRELFVGPRSHVHLARDDATGRHVVLKTPSVDLQDDAAHLDRFVLEEWAARRIDGPHVVKAATAERPRRHLFVALDFVEGQTLAQWMRDHPRPPLEAVRAIVEQAARGLQALHRREMLHRDLRPENLMIDAAGTVTLIDLGSVHVAGLAERLDAPQAPAVEGTLQYAAPELLLGEGASERSDLFALAAIAYQMLTGQLPYGLDAARVRTPADLRRLHCVPLRHHRPELPAWVDAVLYKALQPDAQRRQEAVSEFVHDLRAPGPQFLQRRPVPLAERDPVRFWQGIALLLALAVVVLIALRVLGR